MSPDLAAVVQSIIISLALIIAPYCLFIRRSHRNRGRR